MTGKVTIPALQQMKRDGRKIVGVVVYDYQMAQIVDRAGVDIVSVGDSVGVNMWGQESELEVTLDQMLLACKAVRRGVERALVSCDLPYGPLQEGTDAAVRAATLLMKDGGADMVKVDAAAEYPDAVRAMTRAGIPVWAQFGVTPHSTAKKHSTVKTRTRDELVAEAKLLEQAGAVMLDFTYSGPVAGPAVTAAVSIPVIGGLGGGPWLDGRVRARLATRSATWRARWTTRRSATRTSRGSRSTRSRRTPTTCAPRARSEASLRWVRASPRRSRKAKAGDRKAGDSVATAVIDGITTRYEVVGSGAPLLMFSPGGFDATIEKWTTQGVYARIRPVEHLSKNTPASSSTGARAESPAAASSASRGRITSRRARDCSTI